MNQVLRTIYVITIGFLLSLDVIASTSSSRMFTVINAANGLADNSAQTINCTKTGRMIISTIGNLNFYDGSTFTHINTRQDYQYQLPLYRGNYHLYFDRHHHLWLKDTHKVTCVDLMLEKFIPDVESVITGMGCNDQVEDMFVDSIGDVWFLTDKGLYSIERKNYYQVTRDRNLQDLDVYNGKLLLLFYDNGEEVGIDLEKGGIMHRSRPYEWAEAQKYTNSSAMMRVGDSYYQIRNGEGGSILLRFDVKTHQWTTLMSQPYHLNSLAVLDNRIYIACSYGYWIYVTDTGVFSHVEELTLRNGRKLTTNCNTLTFDKQGGMWIGTEVYGVLYAKPKVAPFKVYSWDTPEAVQYGQMMEHLTQNIAEFNGMRANCHLIDSRNWSWIGTTTGLFWYKDPKKEPVLFDKNKGLLNNVIHSVIEDKKHNIWLSTSCGISCILFEGDKPILVNSFGSDDNVPNESFANCKSMLLDDGNIIMQGIDHVIVFHPDSFTLSNNREPRKLFPKLIKLLVNGSIVEPCEEKDGNVVIDKAITRVYDISLNADQNTVTLTFSGLNYCRPLQTYYRVRIKELDNEWKLYSYFNGSELVDMKGNLHLPFVGLRSGTYTIEVQASMFPDIWPGTPFSWVLHVNQPWWQATGVYIILLVIIFSLLVVNFFIFNKNTRMRDRRNMEEGDILRKLYSFIDRYNAFDKSDLAPLDEDLFLASNKESHSKLDGKFVDLMVKLLPRLKGMQYQDITMSDVGQMGNIDIVDLYELLTNNLYKSPRDLILLNRLNKAAELLGTTDLSVEKVAEECGFHTPNYLIGNFFHMYKLTPAEYREEHSNG